MTDVAADTLAARRRRAVAERAATLGPVGACPAGLADASGVGTSVADGADVPPADQAAAGTADLVVLLPSADAATVLLLCAEAAEPSG